MLELTHQATGILSIFLYMALLIILLPLVALAVGLVLTRLTHLKTSMVEGVSFGAFGIGLLVGIVGLINLTIADGYNSEQFERAYPQVLTSISLDHALDQRTDGNFKAEPKEVSTDDFINGREVSYGVVIKDNTVKVYKVIKGGGESDIVEPKR